LRQFVVVDTVAGDVEEKEVGFKEVFSKFMMRQTFLASRNFCPAKVKFTFVGGK
jgi:hypothetical protein